jgi:hypothetical protein
METWSELNARGAEDDVTTKPAQVIRSKGLHRLKQDLLYYFSYRLLHTFTVRPSIPCLNQ